MQNAWLNYYNTSFKDNTLTHINLMNSNIYIMDLGNIKSEKIEIFVDSVPFI